MKPHHRGRWASQWQDYSIWCPVPTATFPSILVSEIIDKAKLLDQASQEQQRYQPPMQSPIGAFLQFFLEKAWVIWEPGFLGPRQVALLFPTVPAKDLRLYYLTEYLQICPLASQISGLGSDHCLKQFLPPHPMNSPENNGSICRFLQAYISSNENSWELSSWF